MVRRRLALIAVMGVGPTIMHPMIGEIGFGEAMHGLAAVTEGHDRWRRGEAKRGKDGECHRHPESWPRAKRLQHRSIEKPADRREERVQ